MTTYERAQDKIAPYVRPLFHGTPLPPLDVKDETGRPLRLTDDYLCGKSLLLVLLNTCDAARAQQVLSCVAERYQSLENANVTVIGFSPDSNAANNRALRQSSGFQWPLPADATGQIYAGLGVHKGHGACDRLIWVTPLRQVHAWFDDSDDLNDTLDTLMSQTIASPAGDMPLHAPVLLIPDVLSRAECHRLIESVESGAPLTVSPPKPGELSGDYQIPVYDYNRQDRVDHIIKDQATQQLLDERIFQRVVPVIKKSFAFDVTRREDLHVARYEGAREGSVVGHRDNVTAATAHRKFALSLNLNDDYDGGDVVFKEYSQAGYKSAAGAALIFSSALLHEVRETTRGVRYTLISHFFNDQGGAAR
ncbi:MAG: redoxin domain-containing protein [Pseudomonadota bacterium]